MILNTRPLNGALAACDLAGDEQLVLDVKRDFEHAAVSEKLKALLKDPPRPRQAQERTTIVADSAANTVFVSGRPEKLALAKAGLGKLDVPPLEPPQMNRLPGRVENLLGAGNQRQGPRRTPVGQDQLD